MMNTEYKEARATVTKENSTPPQLGGKDFSVEFTLDGEQGEKAYILSRDEIYDYDPKFVRGIMSRWWSEGDRVGWRMTIRYVPWKGRNMVIGFDDLESPDPKKDPASNYF